MIDPFLFGLSIGIICYHFNEMSINHVDCAKSHKNDLIALKTGKIGHLRYSLENHMDILSVNDSKLNNLKKL